MLVPLLVLVVVLVLFGAGGLAIHVLWDVPGVAVAVVIWRIGFFVRAAEPRGYRWRAAGPGPHPAKPRPRRPRNRVERATEGRPSQTRPRGRLKGQGGLPEMADRTTHQPATPARNADVRSADTRNADARNASDRPAADRAGPDPAAMRRIFPSFPDQASRFAHYAAMRRGEPVHGDPELGVWSVYRYGDVRRVLTDHSAFSSERTFGPPPGAGRGPNAAGPASSLPATTPAAARGAGPAGRPAPPTPSTPSTPATGDEGPGGFLRRTLLNSDPPRHSRLRSLVTRAFTPKAVQAMEPLVRELTRAALAPALKCGGMDVMAELARPVPITVIARMLGLPPEDEPRFRAWAETFNGAQDLADAPDDPQALQARFRRMQEEMDAYFAPVVERKRRDPGDDLISHLAQAAVDGSGERLSSEDLEAFCQLLLLAGFVTTTNLIGNGFWLLSRHPAALAALRADPATAPACVEEILRYLSPVQAFVRRAARPVEVAGCVIPADARVVAWIGSANRDEDAFPDAAAFDPAREPNPHLAFGHGIHFCLGAPLARLEGRVVLEELARGVAALEPAADSEPSDFTAGFLYGPTRLRVGLRAG